MAGGKLIDWNYLRDQYISRGTPIEDPILDDPEFRLIFHPDPQQLGVRLQLASGQDAPQTGQLRNISVGKVQIAGRSYAQVMTGSEGLFPSIYALIGDVLRRIEEGERDCLRALAQSLQNFETLVAKATGISREEAIGLYGELCVLEAVSKSGAGDAKAWIGSNRQSHDFRIGSVEYEVKTTSSNVRHHIVHGLNQLTPSPGHSLFLLSIRLGLAGSGAGRDLDRLVSDLKDSFAVKRDDAEYFDDELRKSPYKPGHYECTVAYQLAAPIMRIAIGPEFPIVNPARIADVFGQPAAARVLNMQLFLNLEGLGVEFTPVTW